MSAVTQSPTSRNTDRPTGFVVQPEGKEPGLSMFRAPVGQKALREGVASLRELIDERDGSTQPVLASLARDLYNLLIRAGRVSVSRQ
jgi:hypothetical protein